MRQAAAVLRREESIDETMRRVLADEQRAVTKREQQRIAAAKRAHARYVKQVQARLQAEQYARLLVINCLNAALATGQSLIYTPVMAEGTVEALVAHGMAQASAQRLIEEQCYPRPVQIAFEQDGRIAVKADGLMSRLSEIEVSSLLSQIV